MATTPIALVVEDDPIISQLLQFGLSREGFEVQALTDGRAALDYIAAHEAPAVVVLDVMLPFADGLQLVNAIRERAGWGKVPVLMLTAKSHERDIVRALDAGANDYVIKPFRPEELMARIRRLCKGGQ